jgi:hypothetical protein
MPKLVNNGKAGKKIKTTVKPVTRTVNPAEKDQAKYGNKFKKGNK